MTKQITLLDVLLKIDLNIAHDNQTTTKDDLRALFMIKKGWPIIGSECTFNEKIRTLSALQLIKPLRTGKIYALNWDKIDAVISELQEAY